MRALLECAACCAPEHPIPQTLLLAALDGDRNPNARPALAQLEAIDYMIRIDAAHVRLSATAQHFLAERTRSPRTVAAVEFALLRQVQQLLAQNDEASLGALRPHLIAVMEQALPRADDNAALLVSSFLILTLEAGDLVTARRYLPRILAFEAASGHTVLPDGMVANLTVPLSEPMGDVLQLLACVAAEQPLPDVLIYHCFDPPEQVKHVLDALLEGDYVEQVDPDCLRLTASGRAQQLQIAPAIYERVAAGLGSLIQDAIEQHDETRLQQLLPHIKVMADTALPKGDEVAYQLLLALISCLMATDELLTAARYLDKAEALEAELGIERGQFMPPEDPEKEVQFHTQVAVDYFQRREYALARRHFEQAQAANEDPALRPLLQQKIGNCAGALGDETAKILAYTTALQFALLHHGRDSWQLLQYRNEVANLLLEYGELAAAADHLTEALHRAARGDEADRFVCRERAKAHLLAGAIAYRQGEVEQAEEDIDRGLALTRQLMADWHSRANLLVLAAFIAEREGKIETARALGDEAAEWCEGKEDVAVSAENVLALLTQIRALRQRLQ